MRMLGGEGESRRWDFHILDKRLQVTKNYKKMIRVRGRRQPGPSLKKPGKCVAIRAKDAT